jgi:hypothetical protein
MKKFNLFNEIIIIDSDELKKVIKSGKKFALNIKGEICHEALTKDDIFIYHGIPNKEVSIELAFGNKYQILIDDKRALIKAFGNWQELITLNTPLASYDDTTADGIAEFSNKDLEDIGWHSTEFNITYRELVEVLEDKIDGILLCIEQEKPYQFSGLGFITDYKNAYDVLFEYTQNRIIETIKTDNDYKQEFLNDDELEALKFFNLAD